MKLLLIPKINEVKLLTVNRLNFVDYAVDLTSDLEEYQRVISE